MKSIQDYKVEEQHYTGATFYGILLILGYLVLRFVFEINISAFQNPLVVLGLAYVQIVVYIALILARIIAVVWTYRIALRQERNALTWAFWALLFPPVALISIANVKEKFESEEIRKVVLKARGEYNTRTGQIYNNHANSSSKQKEEIKKIRNEYDLILRSRLVELRAYELVEHLQLLKEQEELTIDFNDAIQKEVLIEDIKNNLMGSDKELNKCPACNSYISTDSIICSECEIILK